MAATKKTRRAFAIPDAHRMSATKIGQVFGVTRQSVAKWKCPRNEDKTYDLPAVVAWQMDKASDEVERAIEAGGDWPALERYRAARADKAELEAAQLRGLLVEIDVVRPALAIAASIIRRGIDKLERRFGKEAHKTMMDAVDHAEAKMGSLIKEAKKK